MQAVRVVVGVVGGILSEPSSCGNGRGKSGSSGPTQDQATKVTADGGEATGMRKANTTQGRDSESPTKKQDRASKTH